MFDLTKNPFHLLRVPPEATAGEIAEAREDAAADGVAPEQELQAAAGALTNPRRRLTCEMSSLWGVSPSSARALLEKLSGGEPPDFSVAAERPPLARANLAAHVCAMPATAQIFPNDDARRDAVEQLIEARENIVESDLRDGFNAARKRAGVPVIRDEHLREASGDLARKHLEAALNAVENAAHPGALMTGIVEEWRYVKTQGGIFVHDMVGGYDRWSASVLRPIGEKIRKAAEALRRNPDDGAALAVIERGLAEWDEYSQPVQLKEEAKGLDERESLKLCRELRQLTLHLANEKNKYNVSLKISNALMRTFPELPAVRGHLSDDIKALKKLAPDEALAAKVKPLLELVSEISEDLAGFAAAVQARDGKWVRFDRTLSAIGNDRELASKDQVWNILCNIIVELRDDYEQASFLVLGRIAQEARDCNAAPQKIRETLNKAVFAARLNQRREKFVEAMKREDAAAARKAALEIAEITDDEEERRKAREIAGRLKSGGIPWWIWVGGAAILYSLLSQ